MSLKSCYEFLDKNLDKTLKRGMHSGAQTSVGVTMCPAGSKTRLRRRGIKGDLTAKKGVPFMAILKLRLATRD